MANPIVNFTTAIDASTDQMKLILTDTSDYTDVPTVLPRTWVIIHADGRKEIIAAPLAEYSYPLAKDEALSIRLALNYNPADDTLGFSKAKNVLAHPSLSLLINLFRRQMLNLFRDRLSRKSIKLRDDIAWISALEECAISSVSTDLVKTQEALDDGNKYANEVKCSL